MPKIPAAKIVRSFMTVTGKGRHCFNDKTSFGRSIKVWGADHAWHHEAAKVLNQHGYKTALVKTPVLEGPWTQGGATRIWVYE